ncbi:MAG TPA: SPOR domain-containing protein [Planctomycetota bacterium]|nr:SPOR domain-containing protein [Planctomycetota bacterium]
MSFRKNTAEAFEVLRQIAEQKKARASEASVLPPDARGGDTAGSSLAGAMTQGTVTQGTVVQGPVAQATMAPGTPEAAGSMRAGISSTGPARAGAGRVAGQREGRFQRKPLLRAPTPGRTLAGGPPRPSPAPPGGPRQRGGVGGGARPERPRSRAWAEWMGIEPEPETETGGRSAPEGEPPLEGAQVLVPDSSEGTAAPSRDRERFAEANARVEEERGALLVEGRSGDSRHDGSPNRPLDGRPAFLEGTRAGFFDDWSLADGPDPLVRPRVDPVLLAARTRPLAGASVPVGAGLEVLQALRIDVVPPAVPDPSGPERSPVEPAFESPVLATGVTTLGAGLGGLDGTGGDPPERFPGAGGPPAPEVPGETEGACGGPAAGRVGSSAPDTFFQRAPRASAASARAGSGLLALLDRRIEMKLSTLLVLAMGGVIAVTLSLTYLRMPAPEDPYFAHRREGHRAGSLAAVPSAAGSVPSDVDRAGGGSLVSLPAGPGDATGAAAIAGALRQPIWSPASTPFPEAGGRSDSDRAESPTPGPGPDTGSADSNTGHGEARPAVSREASPSLHMIQVRARESHEGAQRILTYLDDFGFEDFLLDPDPRGARDSDGRSLYTVFVGRFSDREEAQAECRRLKRETRLRPYKHREDFFHDSLVITRQR